MLLLAVAAELVSLTASDGAAVRALAFGQGESSVVLAHGGRYNKESWDQQARAMADAGFRVLAIDLRRGGDIRLDVLAGVKWLRRNGAKTVAVVGASMGGDAAAEAAETEPHAIDRIVLLAAGAYTPLVQSKARKLYIMSRDDVIGEGRRRLPAIRAAYEKSSHPKQFIELEGKAHAQAIFGTDQSRRLMSEILSFLSAK